MPNKFAEIVEDIKTLSFLEKQELQELIEKYLIEERREEIYQNHIQSLIEMNKKSLKFSNKTATLKEMLSND